MAGRPVVRPAGPGDIPALVELRIEFMHIIKNSGLTGEDEWRRGLSAYFGSWMARGRLFAWLAADGDRPVATAALRLDRTRRGRPGPWDGYVMSIYTQPAWRGKGLATELLGSLIREASSLGLPRLILHPTEDGRALYSSLGFRIYRGLMILEKENFHEPQA